MTKMNETVLEVQGMTCPSCVRHIDEALREVEGVHGVEVHLKQGKVRVLHAGPAVTRAFIEALRDAGYESKQAA